MSRETKITIANGPHEKIVRHGGLTIGYCERVRAPKVGLDGFPRYVGWRFRPLPGEYLEPVQCRTLKEIRKHIKQQVASC